MDETFALRKRSKSNGLLIRIWKELAHYACVGALCALLRVFYSMFLDAATEQLTGLVFVGLG